MKKEGLIKLFMVDKLSAEVYETRPLAGQAAAWDFAERFIKLASSTDEVRMIFAAGASQTEFLEYLSAIPGLPWHKAVAFHMDDYHTLPAGHPQLFQVWVGDRLFDKVPFKKVHRMALEPADPEAACAEYAALLAEAPVQLLAFGIGENGHIAFNDPPVADFNDPVLAKVIEMDPVCRQQQVNDGAFPSLDEVPTHAMTLTIPALMRCEQAVCTVPGPTKTMAVKNTLEGPIDTSCPASIIRTHPSVSLYLDRESAAEVI